jgi:ATP-binding cassette subfamily B protein
MTAVTGDRLLVRAARHGGPWTVGLAVAALTTAGADLLLPAAMGAAVDAVLAPTGRPGRWLAIAVALIVLIAAAEILTDLAAGMSTARATARLRHHLVRHIFALDLRAARRYPSGDLVSRLVSQVPDAAGAGAAVVLAGTALVPPLGSLVALTIIDPWLGVTFVAGLLVLTLLLRTYVIDTADAATRYQHSQSDIAARLTEALVGARTIAAAGTVDQEMHRVLRPLPELGRHGARSWDAIGLAAAQGVMVAPLLQIAVVAVAGMALTAGRLTPGALLAALQYVALGTGLGSVVSVLGRIARSRAGSRRAAEILSADLQRYGESELPAGPGPRR